VVLRMRDRAALVRWSADDALIGQLVAEHAFAEARRVDAALRGPPGPGLVQDSVFSDPGRQFPFGWDLADKGDAGAERGMADGRPALLYRASARGQGVVATQLLALGPGRYRLTTIAAGPASGPYWALTCGEAGGGQIARLGVPAQGNASIDFAVPSDCAGQWLALTLPTGEGAALSGAILSVSVSR
jgi:hypothetical protein